MADWVRESGWQEVRWVKRGNSLVLQQAYILVNMRDGEIIKEWRDVPIEEEENGNGG